VSAVLSDWLLRSVPQGETGTSQSGKPRPGFFRGWDRPASRPTAIPNGPLREIIASPEPSPPRFGRRFQISHGGRFPARQFREDVIVVAPVILSTNV